jgi:hypothetical protein
VAVVKLVGGGHRSAWHIQVPFQLNHVAQPDPHLKLVVKTYTEPENYALVKNKRKIQKNMYIFMS